jgi:hypothetical protein
MGMSYRVISIFLLFLSWGAVAQEPAISPFLHA